MSRRSLRGSIRRQFRRQSRARGQGPCRIRYPCRTLLPLRRRCPVQGKSTATEGRWAHPADRKILTPSARRPTPGAAVGRQIRRDPAPHVPAARPAASADRRRRRERARVETVDDSRRLRHRHPVPACAGRRCAAPAALHETRESSRGDASRLALVRTRVSSGQLPAGRAEPRRRACWSVCCTNAAAVLASAVRGRGATCRACPALEQQRCQAGHRAARGSLGRRRYRGTVARPCRRGPKAYPR